jgi:cytochrome c-type biogenesis protein CcmF
MSQIGYVSLLVAFVTAIWGATALSLGAWKNYPALLKSGRLAAWSTVGLIFLATVCAWIALLSDDFSLRYVIEVSARELAWFYKLSALWGGQEGSLLLWVFILCILLAIVLVQTRQKAYSKFAPYVLAVMLVNAAFFVAMCGLVTNVFQTIAIPPSDGKGLNPLLQHPGMVIHPPMMYMGYVMTIVAAAFAFAALITHRLDNTWIRFARRWTLSAWIFLTVGNFLGGIWAYEVLSFGGYWAWDPVENAAIMPWLMTTAVLHSTLIQQRRGMFKVWNISLTFLAFLLSLFGTFITRSGILSSVHAFGESTLGPYFMVWISLLLAVGFGMLFLRLPALKSEEKLDSIVSRESSFLFNNILFFLSVAFLLWGTLAPVVVQAFTGTKQEVTADYYSKTQFPVLLAMLFLMGIGPLIAWRRSSLKNLINSFWLPAIAGILTGALLFTFGVREFMAVVGISICVFTIMTVLIDYSRGIRSRRKHGDKNAVVAVQKMVKRSPSRYGGLMVHLGILIVAIVIIASSVYARDAEAVLKPGETLVIQGISRYELTFERVDTVKEPLRTAYPVTVRVVKNGVPQAPLYPSSDFYPSIQQILSVVTIRNDWVEDLWLTVGNMSVNADNKIESLAMLAITRPLMPYSWLGLAIIILGLFMAIWFEPLENRRYIAQAEKTAPKDKVSEKEVVQV